MVRRKRRDVDIVVHPDKCTGCLLCQIWCSFKLTGTFNPSLSAILVDTALSGVGAIISFTEECDLCTLCARYCPYGALEIRKTGAAVHG